MTSPAKAMLNEQSPMGSKTKDLPSEVTQAPQNADDPKATPVVT